MVCVLLSFVLLLGALAADGLPIKSAARPAMVPVFQTLITFIWRSLSRMMCTLPSGKIRAFFHNMKNIFRQLIEDPPNPPYNTYPIPPYKYVGAFSFRNHNAATDSSQKNKSHTYVSDELASLQGPGEMKYSHKYPVRNVPYTFAPTNFPSHFKFNPTPQYRRVKQNSNYKHKEGTHWLQFLK